MKTPWTRLEGGALWSSAEQAYRENGLPYHSFDHVRTLYRWADRLGLPWSARLDETILVHDVIMDRGPGLNEAGSAEWLCCQANRSPEWASPILSTIEHRPSQDQLHLAMLDLMDFTEVATSRHNSELLRQEAMKVRGADFDQQAWVRGTIGYLSGLSARIREDLPKLEEPLELRNWTRIAHGVAVTVAVLPMRYDPHPASGIERFTPTEEKIIRLLVASGAPVTSEDVADLEQAPAGRMAIRHPQHSILRHMLDRGLAEMTPGPDGEELWSPSDRAREWLDRMNAPAQDYPEPEFPG